MTTRHIECPSPCIDSGNFPLILPQYPCNGYLGHPFEKWLLSPPRSCFPLGVELGGETRRTYPLAFQRGNPTQGRKTHALWQHGLREALHLQNKRSSENCSTRDFLADSVLPALGHLAVVMVQPSQDRNSNHFASFVHSGSR